MRFFLCFLMTLMSFCCSTSLPAQISLGFKAGANLAQQSIEDIDLTIDSDEITGYTWGAFLEIPIGESNIHLQPEFLLMQKGGKLSVPNIKTTLNYIEVPILLKLKIINSSLLSINILGGPTFGYATSGAMVEDATIVKINFGDDNIKRFDLGIHAGGGAAVHFGSLGVFGDVRYMFGLNDLDETAARTVKNKGLIVSAGLQFRLFGR